MQRSLAHLREQGYLCDITEHYNGFSGRKNDLFGFGDILAIREGEVLMVQTTSHSNVSARVNKITDSQHLPAIRKAGIRIEVHGWTKDRKEPRTVDLS